MQAAALSAMETGERPSVAVDFLHVPFRRAAPRAAIAWKQEAIRVLEAAAPHGVLEGLSLGEWVPDNFSRLYGLPEASGKMLYRYLRSLPSGASTAPHVVAYGLPPEDLEGRLYPRRPSVGAADLSKLARLALFAHTHVELDLLQAHFSAFWAVHPAAMPSIMDLSDVAQVRVRIMGWLTPPPETGGTAPPIGIAKAFLTRALYSAPPIVEAWLRSEVGVVPLPLRTLLWEIDNAKSRVVQWLHARGLIGRDKANKRNALYFALTALEGRVVQRLLLYLLRHTPVTSVIYIGDALWVDNSVTPDAAAQGVSFAMELLTMLGLPGLTFKYAQLLPQLFACADAVPLGVPGSTVASTSLGGQLRAAVATIIRPTSTGLGHQRWPLESFPDIDERFPVGIQGLEAVTGLGRPDKK